MAKLKPRTIITPTVDTDLAGSGGKSGLVYWKEILPRREIHYRDKTGRERLLDFNDAYHRDLKMAFEQKALDQTPFVLADKDNEHTMDPERFRAEVEEMRDWDELPDKIKAEIAAKNGERKGSLFGKLRFANEESAKAVLLNPKLGVSARIREGVERAVDQKKFPRAIIHVLGTLDQKLAGAGMSGWTPALDFSMYDSVDVLDLSSAEYTEALVAKNKGDKKTSESSSTFEFDLDTITAEDISNFTDEQLDAFLAAVDAEPVEGDPTDPSDDSDSESDPASPPQLQEAALSANDQNDIQLAQAAARAAGERATEALRRMAAAEWERESESYLRDGVPPHCLDLAEPVLNRPDEMVIDLSNSGDEDVNVSAIIRGLLDAAKGTIDLANEQGHLGSVTAREANDPDDELIKEWNEYEGVTY